MSEAYALSSIGGWFVGCQCEVENLSTVVLLAHHSYFTTRTHYAPMIPDGVPAYELTDAGVERLRTLRGNGAATHALQMRDRYRANARKHGPRGS